MVWQSLLGCVDGATNWAACLRGCCDPSHWLLVDQSEASPRNSPPHVQYERNMSHLAETEKHSLARDTAHRGCSAVPHLASASSAFPAVDAFHIFILSIIRVACYSVAMYGANKDYFLNIPLIMTKIGTFGLLLTSCIIYYFKKRMKFRGKTWQIRTLFTIFFPSLVLFT